MKSNTTFRNFRERIAKYPKVLQASEFVAFYFIYE